MKREPDTEFRKKVIKGLLVFAANAAFVVFGIWPRFAYFASRSQMSDAKTGLACLLNGPTCDAAVWADAAAVITACPTLGCIAPTNRYRFARAASAGGRGVAYAASYQIAPLPDGSPRGVDVWAQAAGEPPVHCRDALSLVGFLVAMHYGDEHRDAAVCGALEHGLALPLATGPT